LFIFSRYTVQVFVAYFVEIYLIGLSFIYSLYLSSQAGKIQFSTLGFAQSKRFAAFGEKTPWKYEKILIYIFILFVLLVEEIFAFV
jgi:hypothetical protein